MNTFKQGLLAGVLMAGLLTAIYVSFFIELPTEGASVDTYESIDMSIHYNDLVAYDEAISIDGRVFVDMNQMALILEKDTRWDSSKKRVSISDRPEDIVKENYLKAYPWPSNDQIGHAFSNYFFSVEWLYEEVQDKKYVTCSGRDAENNMYEFKFMLLEDGSVGIVNYRLEGQNMADSALDQILSRVYHVREN